MKWKLVKAGYKIKELDRFVKEIKHILYEKFDEYHDSWRNTNIGELRDKIDEQMEGISNIIAEKIDWDKEKVKKKIIHIVNYWYFIFTNLSK